MSESSGPYFKVGRFHKRDLDFELLLGKPTWQRAAHTAFGKGGRWHSLRGFCLLLASSKVVSWPLCLIFSQRENQS